MTISLLDNLKCFSIGSFNCKVVVDTEVAAQPQNPKNSSSPQKARNTRAQSMRYTLYAFTC